MKIIKRISFFVLIAVLSFILMSGCTTGDKKTIKFADVGWDSILFHNAVAGTVAEIVFGYDWEEVSGSTPITHEAVKKGEIDIHMEIWTDNLPNYASDLENDELKELSVNFDDNIQGFYIPRYVVEGDEARGIEAVAPDLKTVEDLKDYADLFTDPEDSSKGIIYGGITGWEITEIMYKKYLHYGLDESFNYLEPGTDAATSAMLVSAYDKGIPIVAYYWEPTWLLGKYDFILLEDEPYEPSLYYEGKTACPSVRVTIGVSKDFYNQDSDFIEFLSNYSTSSDITSRALAFIEENNASYKDAAKWFLIEYREMVKEWLSPEQAEALYQVIG